MGAVDLSQVFTAVIVDARLRTEKPVITVRIMIRTVQVTFTWAQASTGIALKTRLT